MAQCEAAAARASKAINFMNKQINFRLHCYDDAIIALSLITALSLWCLSPDFLNIITAAADIVTNEQLTQHDLPRQIILFFLL